LVALPEGKYKSKNCNQRRDCRYKSGKPKFQSVLLSQHFNLELEFLHLRSGKQIV